MDRILRSALLFLPLVLQPGCAFAQSPAPWHDPSPHTIQFITVDSNVKLEVLDWGGSGRPLVFLAGLGNTAHVFDDFAPKFTPEYHVYGITRRGFGASSVPVPESDNYSADRLGDDVLAVMDALKIEKPVLIGHSIAGEELSSIATRHPERVAGLIYLDAAYIQAYYDRARGDRDMDLLELQRKLDEMKKPLEKEAREKLVKDLLQLLPVFERDLQVEQERLQALPEHFGTRPVPTDNDLASFSAYHSWYTRAYGMSYPEAELRQDRSDPALDGKIGKPLDKSAVVSAIYEGEQKYTDLRAPVLAIYAIPKKYAAYYSAAVARSAAEAVAATDDEAAAKSFEKGVPSAKVVRFAHADHYVFLSNEADVLREMRAFLAGLH